MHSLVKSMHSLVSKNGSLMEWNYCSVSIDFYNVTSIYVYMRLRLTEEINHVVAFTPPDRCWYFGRTMNATGPVHIHSKTSQVAADGGTERWDIPFNVS